MARALEGASVSLYGQAGAMRAADHQFQQSLVVGVMDRPAPRASGSTSKARATAFVVRQITAEKAAQPRPARCSGLEPVN